MTSSISFSHFIPSKSPTSRPPYRRSSLLIRCGNSPSPQQNPYRTIRTVTISHSDLKDKGRDLSAKIEQGFGPDGHGIISISDLSKRVHPIWWEDKAYTQKE